MKNRVFNKQILCIGYMLTYGKFIKSYRTGLKHLNLNILLKYKLIFSIEIISSVRKYYNGDMC